MCLIIDNPKGIAIDPELLKNAARSNADGWGIMSTSRRKLRIIKGLDMADLGAAAHDHVGAPHTIHFRYATHGGKDLDNCHPFEIMGGKYFKYAVMHNGMLSIPRHDPARSDTYHFCQHVLAPILAADPKLFGTQYLRELLGHLIGGGNKLVILRNDGARMIINEDLGVRRETLWLSNSHSIPAPPRLPRIQLSRAEVEAFDSSWEYDSHGWDDSPPAEDTRSRRSSHGSWFPDFLEDLEGLRDGDLLDFVADNPESTAELIQDYLDSRSYGTN